MAPQLPGYYWYSRDLLSMFKRQLREKKEAHDSDGDLSPGGQHVCNAPNSHCGHKYTVGSMIGEPKVDCSTAVRSLLVAARYSAAASL